MYSFPFGDYFGVTHIFIHESEPVWALYGAAWLREGIFVSVFVLPVTTETNVEFPGSRARPGELSLRILEIHLVWLEWFLQDSIINAFIVVHIYIDNSDPCSSSLPLYNTAYSYSYPSGDCFIFSN